MESKFLVEILCPWQFYYQPFSHNSCLYSEFKINIFLLFLFLEELEELGKICKSQSCIWSKCRFWQNLDSVIQEGKRAKNSVRQNYAIALALWYHFLDSIQNWNYCFPAKWKTHLEFRKKMSLFQNHFKDRIYHGLVKNTAENHLPFQGNRKDEEREGSWFFG